MSHGQKLRIFPHSTSDRSAKRPCSGIPGLPLPASEPSLSGRWPPCFERDPRAKSEAVFGLPRNRPFRETRPFSRSAFSNCDTPPNVAHVCRLSPRSLLANPCHRGSRPRSATTSEIRPLTRDQRRGGALAFTNLSPLHLRSVAPAGSDSQSAPASALAGCAHRPLHPLPNRQLRPTARPACGRAPA